MRGLERRLKRLEEGRGYDASGFAPHSPAWLAYWTSQYEHLLAGESHVQFTIEAFRAMLQADDSEEDDDD